MIPGRSSSSSSCTAAWPGWGAGNHETTLRALAACGPLPADAEILDLGCGTGAQTMDLAAATEGRITAVDLMPEFLDDLVAAARERGLQRRIQVQVADMAALPFAAESFDLIWSEGAAYHIGFDVALRDWTPLLNPGGRLALSELCWFGEPEGDAIRAYWAENHPAMRNVDEQLAVAAGLGLECLAHFPVPPEAWTVDYFGPLARRLPGFRERHAEDADALAVADATEHEMAMMERCATTCGYEFFVFRRA